MKDALEKIMDELRVSAERSKENRQKKRRGESEENYPGKWDYYVETD